MPIMMLEHPGHQIKNITSVKTHKSEPPEPKHLREHLRLVPKGVGWECCTSMDTSQIHQQPPRILQRLLDPHQERHRPPCRPRCGGRSSSARYIIGRMTIWPFTTTGRSWILCMPRMPDCGGLRMGEDISAAVDAAVGDGEAEPPCISAIDSLPSRARRPSSAIFFSIPGEGHPIGVAHHGDDEPGRGADGDAHVDVVLVDHVAGRRSRR